MGLVNFKHCVLFLFALSAPTNNGLLNPSNTHLGKVTVLPSTAPPLATLCIATTTTALGMAQQVDQQEAQAGIDKVVNALRKDKSAQSELGRLVKVTNVLGYGSPKVGTLAVRFNAQFQKGGGLGQGRMPFGLGQKKKQQADDNQSGQGGSSRGVMVGQVKASLDANSGKVLTCSVFRDLGYGRSFDMKI